MFTSDERNGKLSKAALIYAGFTGFTAVFGIIYELFSHEVYSYAMIYAFMLPLFLGLLPCLVLLRMKMRLPGETAVKAWNSGIAVLTLGMLCKGVLEIFGTTNSLIYVYPVAGAVLLLTGLIMFIVQMKKDLPVEL